MKKQLTIGKIRQVLKKEISYLREKYGVERIAIYGSFAKGESRKKKLLLFPGSWRDRSNS